MFFVLCVVFLNYLVLSKTEDKPLNLNLNTVLEFNNVNLTKDAQVLYNIKGFLDKIQGIFSGKDGGQALLNAFNVAVPTKAARRNSKYHMKFTDFIEQIVILLKKFNNDELQEFILILDDELRKYHYKGCKFHEVVQNSGIRRYISDSLDKMRTSPISKIRHILNKYHTKLENRDFTDVELMVLEYLNGLYGRQSVKHMVTTLNKLESHMLKSKRSTQNLVAVVRKGVRSLIFDFYSNLTPATRRDLKMKVITYFLEWGDHSGERSLNTEIMRYSTSYNKIKFLNQDPSLKQTTKRTQEDDDKNGDEDINNKPTSKHYYNVFLKKSPKELGQKNAISLLSNTQETHPFRFISLYPEERSSKQPSPYKHDSIKKSIPFRNIGMPVKHSFPTSTRRLKTRFREKYILQEALNKKVSIKYNSRSSDKMPQIERLIYTTSASTKPMEERKDKPVKETKDFSKWEMSNSHSNEKSSEKQTFTTSTKATTTNEISKMVMNVLEKKLADKHASEEKIEEKQNSQEKPNEKENPNSKEKEKSKEKKDSKEKESSGEDSESEDSNNENKTEENKSNAEAVTNISNEKVSKPDQSQESSEESEEETTTQLTTEANTETTTVKRRVPEITEAVPSKIKSKTTEKSTTANTESNHKMSERTTTQLSKTKASKEAGAKHKVEHSKRANEISLRHSSESGSYETSHEHDQTPILNRRLDSHDRGEHDNESGLSIEAPTRITPPKIIRKYNKDKPSPREDKPKYLKRSQLRKLNRIQRRRMANTIYPKNSEATTKRLIDLTEKELQLLTKLEKSIDNSVKNGVNDSRVIEQITTLEKLLEKLRNKITHTHNTFATTKISDIPFWTGTLKSTRPRPTVNDRSSSDMSNEINKKPDNSRRDQEMRYETSNTGENQDIYSEIKNDYKTPEINRKKSYTSTIKRKYDDSSSDETETKPTVMTQKIKKKSKKRVRKTIPFISHTFEGKVNESYNLNDDNEKTNPSSSFNIDPSSTTTSSISETKAQEQPEPFKLPDIEIKNKTLAKILKPVVRFAIMKEDEHSYLEQSDENKGKKSLTKHRYKKRKHKSSLKNNKDSSSYETSDKDKQKTKLDKNKAILSSGEKDYSVATDDDKLKERVPKSNEKADFKIDGNKDHNDEHTEIKPKPCGCSDCKCHLGVCSCAGESVKVSYQKNCANDTCDKTNKEHQTETIATEKLSGRRKRFISPDIAESPYVFATSTQPRSRILIDQDDFKNKNPKFNRGEVPRAPDNESTGLPLKIDANNEKTHMTEIFKDLTNNTNILTGLTDQARRFENFTSKPARIKKTRKFATGPHTFITTRKTETTKIITVGDAEIDANNKKFFDQTNET